MDPCDDVDAIGTGTGTGTSNSESNAEEEKILIATQRNPIISRENGCTGTSDYTNTQEENVQHKDLCRTHSKETDMLDKQTTFRKNHSFPVYQGNICRGYEKISQPLDNERSQFGKRSLPPIKKVLMKKNRTLSDCQLKLYQGNSLLGSEALQRNLDLESHFDTFSTDDQKVVFQICDEQLDDLAASDTSTSTEYDVAESSASSEDLPEELREDEEDDDDNEKANDVYKPDLLQEKLWKALKFEELGGSKSPTPSILSAPVIKNNSLIKDESDTQSIVSDSQIITRKVVKKSRRRGNHHHSHSDTSDLIINCNLDVVESMAVKEVSLSETRLDDRQYERDDISETPSTRSAGILPAISSHGARERSYLVGNLTKHGSLLGPDELNRYFPDRRLRLFVGTWNMQMKGIPKNLNDFLLPKHEEFLQDMYVIGVQESTPDQKKWEIKLQETLGVSHVMAHSVSHGDLHMAVFVRRDLIWFCSPFEDDRVTTRMVSRIKTKGAVAIAFQFFGTSLIFITSHFHSGETRVKERVEDYNRIKEKIKLPKRLQCNTYNSPPDDVTSKFDCTFWFGDLNFRVSLPHQIIHDEVNDPNNYELKEVLKGDQLISTMKRGHIFSGFSESKIKFRPTYKFTPGTDTYDTSPKLRVPSYTDRILYKCKENGMISCARYDSVTTLKKSDHRPVYGFFEVCLKPGRDSIPFGGGKFRNDVYEKAAKVRAKQENYQNSSTVCNIL